MAPKRKRSEYEKEKRREDAAKENEKNALDRAFKRINRSLPSEFEKEKSRIGPHSLSALVTKNTLVLAQRAGFLDSLKHLKVFDLETFIHVLANFHHPFVETITDALEKYEGSLSPSTISRTYFAAPWHFQGIFLSILGFFCFFVSGFVSCSLFHKCLYNEPYMSYVDSYI
jgi:hypothetical protein